MVTTAAKVMDGAPRFPAGWTTWGRGGFQKLESRVDPLVICSPPIAQLAESKSPMGRPCFPVFGSRLFPTLSIQRGNGEPHPSLLQPLSPFFKLHRRCTQFDHGEPAAMVRSGMSVGITNNRRQRPQRTDMSSWSEVFVVRALIAFNSGVAYT